MRSRESPGLRSLDLFQHGLLALRSVEEINRGETIDQRVPRLEELQAVVRGNRIAESFLHSRHPAKLRSVRRVRVLPGRIKALRGVSRPQFRLRVDDVRVFYDVSDERVEILAIVAKEDAAEWLEEFGEKQ